MQTKYICNNVTFDNQSLGTCEVTEQITIDRTEIPTDPCDPDTTGLPIYLDKGSVNCTITVTTERFGKAKEWMESLTTGTPVVGTLEISFSGKKITSSGATDVSGASTYGNAKLTSINASQQRGQAGTVQLTFTLDAGSTISHVFTAETSS